jgi:hypothetical protein
MSSRTQRRRRVSSGCGRRTTRSGSRSRREQFDHLYFFQANLNQGIGENRINAGMMAGYPFAPEQVVAFHKVGNTVQLLAKNVKYTAKAGTPEARAVAQAFSDSLLASTAVVSQPHPERKSVLIEANALLLADIPGANSVLERTYRQSYSFDARNSSLTKVRATPEMVTFAVTAHYSLSRVSLPPANPSPGSPPPTQLPSTLPDVRSMFLGFHYSLAKLPDEPMRPRVLDERIGYFWTDRPRLHVGHAARADRPLRQPLAPREEGSGCGAVGAEAADRLLARAQHPRALPGVRQRRNPRVEQGIRADRLQGRDPRRDPARRRRVGRRRRPPRVGALDDHRAARLRRDRPVDRRPAHRRDPRRRHRVRCERAARHPLRSRRANRRRRTAAPVASNRMACDYADGAAQEAGFALDLLEAREAIAPDSPEIEQFIQAYVKDVVMHEVGHTLGLTHNFRASTIYSNEELADAEFTRTHGIAGSVMEYNPLNIALAGKPQGAYNMQTLGPTITGRSSTRTRKSRPSAKPRSCSASRRARTRGSSRS